MLPPVLRRVRVRLAAFGKEPVSYGCAGEVPRPAIGGPYLADTEVLGAERTVLPLGAVCALDVPDDDVGPQTVRVQSWPQTIVRLAQGTAALVGLLLLVLPGCTIRAVGDAGRLTANPDVDVSLMEDLDTGDLPPVQRARGGFLDI